jgi:DNA-binding IclR family transcriptional regulator
VLVVMRVASAHPLRVEQPAGSRVPVHTSAMGKAILAWSHDPAEEVDALIELGRHTTRTLTSRTALKRELLRTRELGYAVNDEERNVGVRAVGAPVLDQQGFAFAAISVQGPTVRITAATVPRLAQRVQDISRRAASVLAFGQP